MRIYDLALVLRSSLSEDKRKKLLDTVKSWAKDLKAAKEESLGEKNFSYSIKKEKSGFYYLLSFQGENIPADFEKRIQMQDEVLRHLLIRKK